MFLSWTCTVALWILEFPLGKSHFLRSCIWPDPNQHRRFIDCRTRQSLGLSPEFNHGCEAALMESRASLKSLDSKVWQAIDLIWIGRTWTQTHPYRMHPHTAYTKTQAHTHTGTHTQAHTHTGTHTHTRTYQNSDQCI